MSEFNNIFNQSFITSNEAIRYCQQLAKDGGFSVRIRTSKLNAIYLVCSKEGLPDHKNQNIIKKRNRLSDRCKCNWKIVLYKNISNKWEFRLGKNMVHNHSLLNDLNIHNYNFINITLPSIQSLDLPGFKKAAYSSGIESYEPSSNFSSPHSITDATNYFLNHNSQLSYASKTPTISFLTNY